MQSIFSAITWLCLLWFPPNVSAASQYKHPRLTIRDVTAFHANIRPFNNVRLDTQKPFTAISNRPRPSAWTRHSLSLIRGGSMSDLVPSTLIPSANTALVVSTFLTAYMLVSGVALVVKPLPYYKLCWKEVIGVIGKSDLDSALLQATGANVLGLGIHILLTLVLPLWNPSTVVNIPRAMGYSLLPRVALILWALVKGEKGGGYHLEGSAFLKLQFAVMSWTAFSLLAGVGNSNVSTKVFSTMTLLKATALVINPVMMTQKLFNVNVSDKARSRFLARVFGNYLATSALLMLTLALGMNPIRAVGVASSLWFVLLFDVAFVSKCSRWLGQESFAWKQFINMPLALVVALVLLLYKP